MASQLIIKSPQPGKKALLISVLTIAAVGVAYGTYYYGHSTAGFDYQQLKLTHDKVQQQLLEADQENARLRETTAVLKKSADIDKKAYSDVDATLKRLQSEIHELKGQVAFYRGIVSPTQNAAGLNISSFKLNKLASETAYHFELVLTQAKQNNRMIRGKAKIMINGLLNGESKKLDVSQLMGKSKKDLHLRFKHFQTIEGDLILPEGFVPSQVLVDLHPTGRGQSAISQSYNWMDVQS
jgi:cell division septum initiation protein DivIVA